MADTQKNLKYFMRDDVDEIVEFPAPDSPPFLDENGKPVMMKVKKLSAGYIQKIQKKNRHERVGKDENGRPYSENGKLLRLDESDYERSGYVLVCEALVDPDPKCKALREHYKTGDPIEVLFGMFRDVGELRYVTDSVLEILGLYKRPTKEEIDEVKN